MNDNEQPVFAIGANVDKTPRPVATGRTHFHFGPGGRPEAGTIRRTDSNAAAPNPHQRATRTGRCLISLEHLWR